MLSAGQSYLFVKYNSVWIFGQKAFWCSVSNRASTAKTQDSHSAEVRFAANSSKK